MNPFDKLPPQDLDAERGVLGSVLLFESVLDEVSAVLTPEMFYLDAHGKMFASMLRLKELQRGIDGLTVSSELERRGEIEEVGGDAYITKCMESVPHAGHAKYYATEVRDRWTQRQVIYACTELLSEAYQGVHNGAELAARASDAIGKIGEQVQRGGRWFVDVAMEAMPRHLSETEPGVMTGFTDVDEITGGLKPAELTILAGRPSMGKTALAANIAENIARRGETVAFFSLEMKDEAVFDRMTLRLVKSTMHQLPKTAKREPDEVQKAVYELGELPIYINHSPKQSLASIMNECRQVKKKRGLKLVVVDYLQLVEPEDRRAPREHQIGQLSWGFKQLSKLLDVPVILLSQLNRACDSRPDKKPVMADLRDSGQVEQNADTIMFPFRPHVYFPTQHEAHEVELILPKNRGGQIGIVNLLWDGPTMTFSSFKEEDSGLDIDLDNVRFDDPY